MICEPMQCDDISKAVLEAWHRVSYGITDAELDEAKNRLVTLLLNQQSSMLSLLLPYNSNSDQLNEMLTNFFLCTFVGTKGSCENIGNSVLSLGRVTPLAELEASITRLSNETIRDVTDKYINNKCLVASAVGPIENLTDYVNLRTRMYWARV